MSHFDNIDVRFCHLHSENCDCVTQNSKSEAFLFILLMEKEKNVHRFFQDTGFSTTLKPSALARQLIFNPIHPGHRLIL